MNKESKNRSSESKNIPLSTLKEVIIVAVMILFFSIFTGLFKYVYEVPDAKDLSLFYFDKGNNPLEYDKGIIIYSILMSLGTGGALTLLSFSLPLRKEKPQLKSWKNWIIYLILFILGMAAHLIIVIGLRAFNVSVFLSFFIATFLFTFYLYLMIKLYFFGYINDKRVFFEIVRFALVGIIASLFDIVTETLFNSFIPLSWNGVLRIIIYVTAGFIIGVIVNYLCSVYMVYKNTTSEDISRTLKGKIMFVLLSAVGLALSWLLRWLFQDICHIGFVTSFILQTLIVMVWNYLSRKYLIFR